MYRLSLSSFLNFLTILSPRKSLRHFPDATHMSFTFMDFINHGSPGDFRRQTAVLGFKNPVFPFPEKRFNGPRAFHGFYPPRETRIIKQTVTSTLLRIPLWSFGLLGLSPLQSCLAFAYWLFHTLKPDRKNGLRRPYKKIPGVLKFIICKISIFLRRGR